MQLISVSLSIPKYNIQMISILAYPYSGYDDFGLDEPLSLREPITSSY